MEKELPVGHKQLIEELMNLPKISMLLFWTLEQKEYLIHRQTVWKYLGARIDYLQQIQIGYRPIDPAANLPLDLQEDLKVRSNYLFGWLQICVANYALIRGQAQQQGRGFPFQNPRELFAAICREFSDREMQEATSRNIKQGKQDRTLTKLRAAARVQNKLFRGGFSEQENEVIQKSFAEDGSWSGFVMAAMIGMNPKHRKNQNEWKVFLKAHKQLATFLKCSGARAIRWNAGHPVWADTDSPVLFPPAS